MNFVKKSFKNNCNVIVKAFENGSIEIDMGFMVWHCNKETICDVNNEEIRAWVKSVYETN